MERLHDALPYLYATCEKLGRVRIERQGETEVFLPGPTFKRLMDDYILQETSVRISHPKKSRRLVAMHIGQRYGRSGLLVALENADGRQQVRLPSPDFSKLFVTFPIAGTQFLPFNVLLDGRFTPEQERDGIHMNDADKELIVSALSTLPSLVRHGVEAGWADAHQLADLSVPDRTFSDESASGEAEWWERIVRDTATATAQEPLIDTVSGMLPAINGCDSNQASFLVASIYAQGSKDFEYGDIHELADELDGLHVPSESSATDWGIIARNWSESGVRVKRLGIKELIDDFRVRASSIFDAPISGDWSSWLSRLILVIDKLSQKHQVDELVTGIIPDQHGTLRGLRDLRVDANVSDEMKDIAADLRIDLKAELVHERLWQRLSEPGFESARRFVEQLSGDRYLEVYAIDRVLEALGEFLPDDTKFVEIEPSSLNHLRASSRAISHLAVQDDIQSLRRCPLLTAADSVAYLTGSQQILAPVSYWPSTQQAYADLYTEKRILSDRYCEEPELQSALGHLIGAGLVIAAPLYNGVRAEIDDTNLLNAMSVDGQNTTKTAIRNETFGQIAFLATDLVQRCGHDPNIAKRLLKFVLHVAAKDDPSWRDVKEVTGTRAGESVRLSLRGAIWPYELKVRAWVPVPYPEDSSEDGFQAYPANENYLRELDEESLRQNDSDARDLLHQVFGFERLDLMLASLDESTRSDLEELLEDDRLVGSAVRHRELLKVAEENPEVAELISNNKPDEIQEILEELDERKRKSAFRETNRSFGHAAQAALAEAIEEYGLELELVDRGFDYEVFPGSLDEVPFSFGVGSYYLEVKATTTGDVRLTPLQAKTAAQNMDRFVLCVIDLRGQELKDEWHKSDVKPYSKIVTGVGDQIVEVYDAVDSLTADYEPVRLRNEDQLRYGLSADLWENGISIDQWIQSLTPTPQPDTAPSHPS